LIAKAAHTDKFIKMKHVVINDKQLENLRDYNQTAALIAYKEDYQEYETVIVNSRYKCSLLILSDTEGITPDQSNKQPIYVELKRI
jgi:hypothetical protein